MSIDVDGQLTDAQLVASFRRDQQLFTNVYDRYLRDIYRRNVPGGVPAAKSVRPGPGRTAPMAVRHCDESRRPPPPGRGLALPNTVSYGAFADCRQSRDRYPWPPTQMRHRSSSPGQPYR